MIRYFFREPNFPLLVESDFRVFGAYNLKKIEMMITKGAFNNDTSYIVIDSTGEGWSFYSESAVISPLCVEKRWNKPKIIKFFVTTQQNMKASTGHGWVAVFWLRRNFFSGLVPSNHCSHGTKAYAASVWQWFDERCQVQSDKRQIQNTATQP